MTCSSLLRTLLGLLFFWGVLSGCNLPKQSSPPSPPPSAPSSTSTTSPVLWPGQKLQTLLHDMVQTRQMREENRRVRLWLYSLDTRLVQVKKEQLIPLLRHLVSRRFPMQRHGLLTFPLNLGMLKDAQQGRSPLQSRELSLIYIRLLAAFEIPSRLVSIANRRVLSSRGVMASLHSHHLTEVWHKGGWVLQDPTYDVEWRKEGKPVSVVELRNLLQQNKEVVATSAPFPTGNRTLQASGRKMASLLEYVEVRWFQTTGLQAGKGRLLLTLPNGPGWQQLSRLQPLSALPNGLSVLHQWDWKKGPASGWQHLASDNPPVQRRIFPKKPHKNSFVWRAQGQAAWVSPMLTLGPGEYVFSLAGRLRQGLGCLSLWRHGRPWKSPVMYYSRQWKNVLHPMQLRWTLQQQTSLRLVLSGCEEVDQASSSSLWEWSGMQLGRLKKPSARHLASKRLGATTRRGLAPTTRPSLQPKDALLHRLTFNQDLRRNDWKRLFRPKQTMAMAYQSMLQRKLKMTKLAFREGFRRQGYWFLKKGSSLTFAEKAVRPTQTLEFWLRWLPLEGQQALVSVVRGERVLWQWSLRGDGQMCFAKEGKKRVCQPAGLTSRQWTFVALRWPSKQSSPAELWVGGRKVAEFDRLPSSASANWRFGAAGKLPAFRGGLDEVSLYRVALSTQQLRNHLPFHSTLLSLEVPPQLFARATPRRAWRQEELRYLDSLVLHLRLDGELLTDPRFGSLNKAVDTGLDVGIHKGAVWLNGKTSHLKIDQQASYPQQTLEFWLSPERLRGGVLSSQQGLRKGNWRWQIFFNPQKHLCLLWFDSSSHTLCTLKPLPLRRWTHIAVTWDVVARQLRLWRGGLLQGQGTLLSNLPNGALWLGVSRTHGFYKGLLDEVALYNKVLPASTLLKHAKTASPLFSGMAQREVRTSSLRHLLFSLSANLPPRVLKQRVPRLQWKNVKYTFGRSGGGYRFNGKDSLLSLNESFSTPQQTLMLWVKPVYMGVSGGLLSSQALSPGRQWRWQLLLDGQQRVCMLVYDSRSWRVCSKRSLKAGVWSHVAVTLEQKQGRMTIYVHGKADAVGKMKGNYPYGHLVIGYSHNVGYFRGTLDAVALFNKALSPKEILGYAKMLRQPRDLYAKETSLVQKGAEPSMFLHLPFRVAVQRHPRLKKRLSIKGLIPDSGLGGQSYFFDGKDDQLVLKQYPSFPQQTLSLWVRPSRKGKQGLVAYQDMSGKNKNWNWQLYLSHDRRACFVFYDNRQKTLCSRVKVPGGVWTHVALVIDLKKSRQIRLYIHGSLQGSHAVNTLNSGGDLLIGKTRYSSHFRGSLDEVLVLDKVLSPALIQKLADPGHNLYRRLYAAYLREP